VERPVGSVRCRSAKLALRLVSYAEGWAARFAAYSFAPDISPSRPSLRLAYARLNEERRGILERVASEGTVYGG
jgi:hypothetical protein